MLEHILGKSIIYKKTPYSCVLPIFSPGKKERLPENEIYDWLLKTIGPPNHRLEIVPDGQTRQWAISSVHDDWGRLIGLDFSFSHIANAVLLKLTWAGQNGQSRPSD